MCYGKKSCCFGAPRALPGGLPLRRSFSFCFRCRCEVRDPSDERDPYTCLFASEGAPLVEKPLNCRILNKYYGYMKCVK